MKPFVITKSITNRTDETFDTYLKEVAKIPMISAEEEKELSIRIQKGDKEARNRLVSANLRFVITVAKQYQGLGIPLMDLINAGNEGAIVAADKFTIDHNCKFISYAVWWIRQAITQSLFSESRTIRVPISQTTFLNKILDTIDSFEKEYERKPSNKEIAKILKCSQKKVREALIGNVSCTSMDVTVGNDEDGCTLGELLSGKEEKETDYRATNNDKWINIERLLSNFHPREQDILRMFYGLEGVQQLPYEEIGKRFGLTGERIRQINNSLIKEIQNKYIDLAKELL